MTYEIWMHQELTLDLLDLQVSPGLLPGKVPFATWNRIRPDFLGAPNGDYQPAGLPQITLTAHGGCTIPKLSSQYLSR